MANISGAVFNSYLDPTTDLTILSCSFIPRVDRSGTDCSLTIRVSMGPAAQVLLSPTNRSQGRQVTGTVNGHSIGTHVIKPFDTISWLADGDYDYTLDFTIPYSPGNVPIVLRLTQQTGATGALACFDTGKGWTVTSAAADLPGQATGLTLGAAIVGSLTGQISLNWSAAPATDGPVLGYDVYYSYDQLTWRHLLRTANLYTAVVLSKFAVPKGASVYLNVAAYGYYGSGALAATPAAFKLAERPLPPLVSALAPAVPFGLPVTLSWSGATTPDGTISEYQVQVSRLAKGASTWSTWQTTATPSVAALETIPSGYTFWVVAEGDQFKYRIFSVNSYGQVSATALETGVVQLRNGIMRAKTGGLWVSGVPWVKVNGIWRKSAEVYIKVAGLWRSAK